MNDSNVENEAFIDRQFNNQIEIITQRLNDVLQEISDDENDYYAEAVTSAVANALALVVINDLEEDTYLGEVLTAQYGLGDIKTKECRIRIDIIEKNRTLN